MQAGRIALGTLFAFIGMASAYAQDGTMSGPTFRWEIPHQGKILRWDGAKRMWELPLVPPFSSSERPMDDSYYLWGEETLCRFRSPGGLACWTQVGRLARDPDGAGRWVWSSWVQLPPRSTPLCALGGKLLIEVAEQKKLAGKVTRKRTLTQVNVETQGRGVLQARQPRLGQCYQSTAIQRDGKGYVFLNTGRVLVWDPSGSGRVKTLTENFFKPIKDKRHPIRADGATPYPVFPSDPFFDQDGRILFTVTTLVEADRTHLQHHVDAVESIEESAYRGFPKSIPDGFVTTEHAKTFFLSLDPETGSVESLDGDRVAHLFRPDPGAPLCALRSGTEGGRFWVNGKGNILPLDLDGALKSAVAAKQGD